MIVSPQFSSEFKPPTLTVQGYQKLLESDAVLAETKKRLVKQGVLVEKDTLHLGGNVETRIFVSSQSETTSLAPMLQTIARGKTSEQATAIANTWAQVFLERINELMAGTTSAAVQFIDEQYPQAQDQLVQAESERDAAANEFQKRHDSLAASWDEKLTAFQNESADRLTALQNETADLVATYQAETTRLAKEFSSQHNMNTRATQLRSLYGAYQDLQSEQARVSSLLQQKQLQLDATRTQLAQAPQYLTLEKAITDDALWQSLALPKKQKIDWKALQGRSLLTQQVNPVFTELSSRLAQIEMEANTLVPRSAQLSQELTRMSATIQELNTTLNVDKAEREKLQQEREAGLAKLKTQ